MEGKVEMNPEQLDKVAGGAYTGLVFIYFVQKGDCLSGLARRYGTTEATICEINNIKNPDFIREGDRLLIPYRG